MNLTLNNKRKQDNSQFIFRGKSLKAKKSQKRLFIEALLMLILGLNLFIFLYTLPGEFVLQRFLDETWFEFSQGILQLADAISKIGGALIVIFLIILGFILISGSILRFARLYFISRTKTKKIRKRPT